MELDCVIMNGNLVIPTQGIMKGSIGIKDEKIAMISDSPNLTKAKETIDAEGKYVFPGVIEPHVHFGLGSKLDEDLITETRSAATGGITTVITYYRQIEPYDDFVDEFVRLGQERACIDFSLHLGVSSEEHISSIPKFCAEYGISSYKFMMVFKGEDAKKAGAAEMNDGVFYDALQKIKTIDGVLPCIHAENIELIWSLRKRIMDQGRTDPLAWAESRPDFTEADFVRRALFLAELTDCPLYIVHTTSKAALDEVMLAREHYSKIFVETCPVYLTHTKEMMEDNMMKVAPPLRSKKDNEALWGGIRDGCIQTVGSDHLALKKESKSGSIWEASMGISGTATVLPSLLSEGYHKRNISLERIAEVTSYNAARIFNLYPRKGNIQVGFDADLAIVDLELEKNVTHEMLNSASDFSIYEGWNLKGWPVSTIVRGKMVMQDGEIVGRKGYGKFIERKPT